jgi:acetyl esterase/lipase
MRTTRTSRRPRGRAAALLALTLSLLTTIITVTAAPVTAAPPAAATTRAYDYRGDASAAHRILATFRPGSKDQPWILEIHGGSWVRGSSADLTGETAIFARAGYTVFNMDYRLFVPGRTTYADQKADVSHALGWIRRNAAHFGIAAARGALYGVSAGGNLALRLGLAPGSGIRAVLADIPISQPQRIGSDALLTPHFDVVNAHVRDLYRYEKQMMGCAWHDGGHDLSAGCLSRWEDFAPQNLTITKASPAVYIYAGAADYYYTYPQARAFANVTHAKGLSVHVEEIAGLGHSPKTFTQNDRGGLTFLTRHL